MQRSIFFANSVELKNKAKWLYLCTGINEKREIWMVPETLKNLSLVQHLASTAFSFIGRVTPFFHLLDRRFNAPVFGYVDSSKRSTAYWITGNLPQQRRADFSKSQRVFFLVTGRLSSCGLPSDHFCSSLGGIFYPPDVFPKHESCYKT